MNKSQNNVSTLGWNIVSETSQFYSKKYKIKPALSALFVASALSFTTSAFAEVDVQTLPQKWEDFKKEARDFRNNFQNEVNSRFEGLEERVDSLEAADPPLHFSPSPGVTQADLDKKADKTELDKKVDLEVYNGAVKTYNEKLTEHSKAITEVGNYAKTLNEHKVNKSEFEKTKQDLETKLSTKADQSALDETNRKLDGKVDATRYTETIQKYNQNFNDHFAYIMDLKGKSEKLEQNKLNTTDYNNGVRVINAKLSEQKEQINKKADKTELEKAKSELEAKKADRTDLDAKLDIADYDDGLRQINGNFKQHQEQINKKADKTELDKAKSELDAKKADRTELAEVKSELDTKKADRTELAEVKSELDVKKADRTELAKTKSELEAKKADKTALAQVKTELESKKADKTALAKVEKEYKLADQAINQKIINRIEPRIEQNSREINNVSRRVGSLEKQVKKINKDLKAGLAGAVAIANLPQAFKPGQGGFSAAAGSYAGQNAVAVGLSRVSEDGKWVIKGSVSINTQGDASAGAGVFRSW
ncbi:hypothetical protein A4G18_06850 [Pasteurellaceae bacterium Pebbles2]|nr:hypothetical protein [Pasteurellaceae bacterium Pebbles2]